MTDTKLRIALLVSCLGIAVCGFCIGWTSRGARDARTVVEDMRAFAKITPHEVEVEIPAAAFTPAPRAHGAFYHYREETPTPAVRGHDGGAVILPGQDPPHEFGHSRGLTRVWVSHDFVKLVDAVDFLNSLPEETAATAKIATLAGARMNLGGYVVVYRAAL